MFSSKKYFVLLAEDAVLDVENILHITDQKPNCPERAELIGCRWAQVDQNFYNRAMGETSLRDKVAGLQETAQEKFRQARKSGLAKFSVFLGVTSINPLIGIGLVAGDWAMQAQARKKVKREIEECWDEAHLLNELFTEGNLGRKTMQKIWDAADNQ